MQNKYLIFTTRFLAGLVSILFGFVIIQFVIYGQNLGTLSLFSWLLSFLYLITFISSLYHLFTGRHTVFWILSITLSFIVAFIGNS